MKIYLKREVSPDNSGSWATAGVEVSRRPRGLKPRIRSILHTKEGTVPYFLGPPLSGMGLLKIVRKGGVDFHHRTPKIGFEF